MAKNKINKTLKIVSWSANGLLGHLSELEIFLNSERIDICLISETHFTRFTYAKIRGYNAYYSIHPAEKAKGGTAIFVKENIRHFEELKIESEKMQVTTINLRLNNNKKFYVSAIYCLARYTWKKEDYTKLFKLLSCNFILGVYTTNCFSTGKF